MLLRSYGKSVLYCTSVLRYFGPTATLDLGQLEVGFTFYFVNPTYAATADLVSM